MKTVREWLNELPYPLNEMAVEENLEHLCDIDVEGYDLSNAVCLHFDWGKAKYGDKLWEDVHLDICNHGNVRSETLSKYSTIIEEFIRKSVSSVKTKPISINHMLFEAYLDGISDVHSAYGDEHWITEIELIKGKFKELF